MFDWPGLRSGTRKTKKGEEGSEGEDEGEALCSETKE